MMNQAYCKPHRDIHIGIEIDIARKSSNNADKERTTQMEIEKKHTTNTNKYKELTATNLAPTHKMRCKATGAKRLKAAT